MNKFAMPMVFISILVGVLFGVLIATHAPTQETATGIEFLPTPRIVDDYQQLLPPSEAKLRMVVFGYMHCPDICPTNLAELATLNAKLTSDGFDQLLEVTLISVDPHRDANLDIQGYVEHFDKSFIGKVLEHNRLSALNRSLGIGYRAAEITTTHYLVSHSPIISLIDNKGLLVGRLRSGFDVQKVADELIRI